MIIYSYMLVFNDREGYELPVQSNEISLYNTLEEAERQKSLLIERLKSEMHGKLVKRWFTKKVEPSKLSEYQKIKHTQIINTVKVIKVKTIGGGLCR
ncbi:hypothetical protein TH1_092 [Shewanella phage Thanatos-1]|nr:hypothetical protein TH1_092 [Shewanella phage Thanatos-1]QLA10660.1 hypothetical protein TH2_092 [Shewanella phage Thanatos-2]